MDIALPTNDRGNKQTRPKNYKFEKRLRALHEALPPETDLFRRPVYKIGDGDVIPAPRPGSQDFLKYPSKGLST